MTTSSDESPHTVECAICGDDVEIAESRSGPGRKPVHEDCFLEWSGEVSSNAS